MGVILSSSSTVKFKSSLGWFSAKYLDFSKVEIVYISFVIQTNTLFFKINCVFYYSFGNLMNERVLTLTHPD
jgi:hypothetical protein